MTAPRRRPALPPRGGRARRALAAASLAACGTSAPSPEPAAGRTETPAPPPAPSLAGAASVVYACPGDFRFAVRLRGDTATVVLPDGDHALPRAPSADGARYEAGGVVLWTRGERATLETPAARHGECEGRPADGPWEAARLLGVDFRAIGQEPGWTLDLDRGRWLRYVGDYGATRVLVAPPPAPRRDAATGATTFRARTDARDVTAVVREAPCRDAMSGEAFAYTVTLRVDGRELQGCGRALTEGALAPGAPEP